jgi:hypothetical protein
MPALTATGATGASRVVTDIAELNTRQGLQHMAVQPTDADADVPPEEIQNGAPRRWAEGIVAANACIFVTLAMTPYQLKKGQMWYTIAQSTILGSTMVALLFHFVGNIHSRMLRFFSGKKIFIKVVGLTLVNWLMVMLMPGEGWEVTDRIIATQAILSNIAFICQDTLVSLSRWLRLFLSFSFISAYIFNLFRVYFVHAAQTLFVIESTNTTITTTFVQGSIATTMITLTASMLVTIWQDKDFQYCALYRSYLPKLAVETAGMKPGSAEMEAAIQDRAAAAVAWTGRPRKEAEAILLSVLVFLSSIVLRDTEMGNSKSGNESMLKIILRTVALALGLSGAFAFFSGNISFWRWKYTLSSPKGLLWIIYTLLYCLSGMAQPSQENPVSSVVGNVYVSLGFLGWLSFDSAKRISRIMQVSITVAVALTLAFTIWMTTFVWQDDAVLADFNGAGVEGTLTRYSLHRTCFINLLLIMGGSIVTVLRKNRSDNVYFLVVEGLVGRQEIMKLVSLNFDLDGVNDLNLHASLPRRLNRHSMVDQLTVTSVH